MGGSVGGRGGGVEKKKRRRNMEVDKRFMEIFVIFVGGITLVPNLMELMNPPPENEFRKV